MIYKLKNAGLETSIFTVNIDGTIDLIPKKNIITLSIFASRFNDPQFYSTIKGFTKNMD